ncbi:AGAP012535-PA [Anopheles gambiae str. PEST]|uniref:AGAP012535-PA n=1 Tax=Anopheles gambiae TaxID=7165 RepID=A0NB48_ANOGA|nr:AGAP012535-PA [Anopheles gambiae str. PEST]
MERKATLTHVYVGNLAPNVNDQLLRRYLSKAGTVILAKIARNAMTGESLLYGSAVFATTRDVPSKKKKNVRGARSDDPRPSQAVVPKLNVTTRQQAGRFGRKASKAPGIEDNDAVFKIFGNLVLNDDVFQ